MKCRQIVCCSLLVCFIILQTSLNAQTDTTVVDTVSFTQIDSLTQPNDVYADTTVKHIYDTSQYFFNWKEDYTQTFKKGKITPRHLIDGDVKALKTQKDFWYIPAIEKMEARLKTDAAFRDSLLKAGRHDISNEVRKDFTQQTWFQFLSWFVIVSVFIAAIIYFLLQHKINLFSPKPASAITEANEEVHENIFQLSYAQLLHKAELEQNYRVAIRLLFLQTLKLLSETNHIQYQPAYTNLQYQQQLHQSKLYNGFAVLTRSYEYVWYGKFDVPKERYTSIKNNFLMFQHNIT